MYQHQKLSPLMFAGGLDADAFFGAVLQLIHGRKKKKERKRDRAQSLSWPLMSCLKNFWLKPCYDLASTVVHFHLNIFFSSACEIIGTISQLFLQQTLVSSFHF